MGVHGGGEVAGRGRFCGRCEGRSLDVLGCVGCLLCGAMGGWWGLCVLCVLLRCVDGVVEVVLPGRVGGLWGVLSQAGAAVSRRTVCGV